MNRWIAHTVRLGAPLLVVGLTWAGDATAAQPPTILVRAKQTVIDLNLGRSLLEEGSQGQDVENLQRFLFSRNYYFDEIDGDYGRATRQAVEAYQGENGLSITGVADTATLVRMGFNVPNDNPRALTPPQPVQVVPNQSFDRPDVGFNEPSSDLRRRELRPGDTGADVSALQSALSSFGYLVAVDGSYGRQTTQAVSTYQSIQELPVTGIADSETLEDIGFNLPSESRAVQSVPTAVARAGELSRGQLRPGDRGEDVRALQRALRSFGLPVGVDGIYGSDTASAVSTYQRTRDLQVTGIADQDTLEALGFEVPDFPFIAAVVGDEAQLAEVREFFPEAYIDRNIEGSFINIGNFATREPAEARSFAARGRDFNARVIYRRSGLF